MAFSKIQEGLRIKSEDIKIFPSKDESLGEGFHLYIRKKPEINSVILTETTKDPLGKNDNYAYRAKEYNYINGDEKRILNGEFLVSDYSKNSLLDSTVEKNDDFGDAFHIFIPETLIYGYPWSRNGELKIGKGTFINIRTFSKLYADYDGEFFDNPFMFDLQKTKKISQKDEYIMEETVLTDDYNPIASEKFKEISQEMIYSKGPDTIIEDISKILTNFQDDKIDLVFAIDATGSMKNDIDKLKKDLMTHLQDYVGSTKDIHFGLLFYRDYGDSYNFMNLPVKLFEFTDNLGVFNKNLNNIKILGTEGGDIPEAVYEAIYASCQYFKWREDVNRQIILIGDAEPHPVPRASKKYSKEFVMDFAKSKEISVHSILLPHD